MGVRPTGMRRLAPWSWALARLRLAVVIICERLDQPRRGRRWLERWCRAPGAAPLLLEALALRCCADGDVAAALELFIRLWSDWGSSELLYRLLFRRRFRSAHARDHALLLQRIAAAEPLPAHFRAYGAIAWAYRTLEDQDPESMAAAVAPIARLAEELEADPGTPSCGREDRENRAKLLISCYTVLGRLHFSLEDFPAFSAVARRSAQLAEQLDLDRIDADVSYRLLSNLLRCLGCSWLEAWSRQDAAALAQVTTRIEAVVREAQSPRHQASQAREDHAGFARQVAAALTGLSLEDRRLEPLYPLVALLFKKKVDGHGFRTRIAPALQRYRDAALPGLPTSS